MWGTAGLLCIFHMKARTAINKQADGNKSEQQSQAWDHLFPGYSSSFVSGLPCLSCCNVTPAGSISPTSLHLCCPLAHKRCSVSGGPCPPHCFVEFKPSLFFLWKQTDKLLWIVNWQICIIACFYWGVIVGLVKWDKEICVLERQDCFVLKYAGKKIKKATKR